MTLTINVVDKATGTKNVLLHIQAAIFATEKIRSITWLCDKPVNFTVSLDRKQLNFTPPGDGTWVFTITVTDTVQTVSKTVTVTVGSGQTQPPAPQPQPEVPPAPQPEPAPTNVLWDSNIHGKWNTKRTITITEGNQKPDDKSIFCAASGQPKLVVNGDGSATLISGKTKVDNLSIRLRSRHQGDLNNKKLSCDKRFGGHGFAIHANGDVEFKSETCHNTHYGAKSFKGPSMGTSWHHITQTSIGSKHTFSVDGKKIGEVTSSNKGDSSLLAKNSYFWLRLNNDDHGRIYIMAINVDSKLDLDCKFLNNTITFKNVRLVKQ